MRAALVVIALAFAALASVEPLAGVAAVIVVAVTTSYRNK